jgi:hypothetical protein
MIARMSPVSKKRQRDDEAYEPYEGSARQRQRRRRMQVIAVLLLATLLLPVVLQAMDILNG